MDRHKFERLRTKADRMLRIDPAGADYWYGFLRGLRRAHFGELFGTEAEHRLWLALADASRDRRRRERGRGYRDGLSVK